MAGPVVLRIDSGSGPYNEQILFSGVIPGSSATNTLRLSGNTSREVISFNPTLSNFQHTIRLQATKHISLDSLTINNLGATFGIGVHMTAISDSNFVQNSNINISLASSSNSNSAGIAISANTSSASSSGNNGNKNSLNNNFINGGFYGISCVGTSAGVFCQRNEVTNNRLFGQASYGIALNWQNLAKVNGNTIDNMLSSNTNSYGLFFSEVDNFEVNKNTINRFGAYGMFFQGTNHQGGSGTNRSQIINNMIGGITYNTNPYGVYFNTYSGVGTYRNVDFWHNSIHLSNAAGGMAHFMQNTTSSTTVVGLDYRNNTFSANNNTNWVGYFYNGGYGSPFTSFLNNNLYSISNPNGSICLINTSGGSGNSWISASFGGANTSSCFWLDPQFINNNTNLHSISAALSNKGVNIGTVTTDIDGDTRPLSPSLTVDIGADEFNVPAENIGVFAIISPGYPLVNGLQNVVVQIKNYGSATITSANVRYKVGVNGAVKTIAWTGSIATNATSNVTFTTPNQFNFTGINDTVIAWTDAPNGLPDAYIFNDTASSIVCQPLSGIYTLDNTIAASATNFTTFASLASKLNTCGVSGPVTVNIAANTYTEQFTLNQIQGASSSNRITLQSASGIASSVNIQFNTATVLANSYVAYLNGADYVTLRNLTLTNTNTVVGAYDLWLANNARFNSFHNVVFNGPAITSPSSNWSLVFANSNSANLPGQGDDNDTFNLCTFNNSSYGLFWNSPYGSNYTRNCAFTNNAFNNQYYMGAYLYMNFDFNFSGNSIITNSTYSNFYGVQHYGGGVGNMAAVRINRNRISAPNANGYGMYFQYLNGNGAAGDDIQVMNNMISIGNGAGSTSTGMYLTYAKGKIQHNTVNITSGNVNSYALYISNNNSYSPISNIKYNIFANSGNGSTSGYCVYSQDNSTAFLLLDSNVYYQGTGAGNFGNRAGTPYANIAAWRAGMGATFDPNSIVVANPNFVSQTDLHISTSTNLRTVNRLSYLTEDIDGPRCGPTTETGADFHPGANDIGVSSIAIPVNGVASPGSSPISVRIRNYGSNTITSADVTYNINGTQVTEAWTGSLGTCDSVTFTFATPYTFTAGFTMKTFTSLPNGSADVLPSNDTSYNSGCLGMGGVYTIGGTPGPTNFTTFGAAITAMQGCGIGSPVIFQVASGTYTEQVSIPAITGASATNTITFDGGNGNVATRILTFATGASGSGLSHVLRFNNCSNVIFRNMTIRSSGTSEAWTVHFMNGANNRLTNCIVDMTGNGTTSTSTNFTSVVINGSTTSRTTTSTIANNHRVDSSTINFGYYGIYSSMNNGALTNFFTNNVFANTYYSGGWFENPQTVKFNNNTINTRSTMTTAQPIYFQSANPSGSNFNEVNGNTIVRTGQYGIYFVSTQGGPSTQGQCYNNFINGMTFAGSTAGIFLNSASNWNLYHNTVNHDINSTSGSNYGIQIQNGSNNAVRNNILSTTIPTAVNWTPLFINPSSAVSAVNSNNYWNPSSSNLVNIGGVNYTAANFNVAYPSGGGLNSINKNPFYVSSSNIHVTSVCNNGENLGVLVDIDGDVRSSTPDIGADEAAVFTVSYTSTPVFSSTGGGVDTIVVSSGDTVVLSGTGANSYSWSGPQSITNAVSFVATSSGDYTVTGTTSGCTNTKKVYLKVNSAFMASTAAQNGVKLTRRGVSGSLIYYGDGVNYYFAIDTSGITSGSLTGDTVVISVQTTIDSFKSSNGANQEHAMYLMPRFWDAKGSFTGTVKIRFPYVPADTALLVSLRDSAWSLLKNVTNTNTLAIKTSKIEWFKTVGVPYTAAYISGIVGNKFPSTIVKPSATYGVTGGGVHYVELAGITSFSGGGAGVGFGPGGGGGGIGLPVTWAGFDVKTLEAGNELIWKTASEQNTDYFEVEYSYDAKQWSVGSDQLSAAGNSADLRTYQFTHPDFEPFVYYRIKQVDLDGAFDYSTIKLAKRAKGKDFQVSVYPTQIPDNGRITIEAKNIDKSQLNLSIVDVTGKFVYSNSFTPSANSLREELELIRLQSGVYFIEISNGQGREVIKVVR